MLISSRHVARMWRNILISFRLFCFSEMAHLSPPPSPPVLAAGQTQASPLDMNASSVIQRASAFSSVLGQKWNARGRFPLGRRERLWWQFSLTRLFSSTDLPLLYNPLFYSGAAFLWPQFLLPQQPITPISPNLANSRDYTLTPEKEEIVGRFFDSKKF